MGDCLPHRLKGSGHCVDMLGGDEGPVNESDGLATPQKDSWRNIAITLIDGVLSAMACLRQPCRVILTTSV